MIVKKQILHKSRMNFGRSVLIGRPWGGESLEEVKSVECRIERPRLDVLGGALLFKVYFSWGKA